MKKFLSNLTLAMMAAILVMTWAADADLGDIWALPSNVWRVNSSGHLIPGTTAVSDIGSSSLQTRYIYGQDAVVDRFDYSNIVTGTNATYTIPSRAGQVFVPSISATRAWTVPAPTVGSEMIVTDTAGNVNVNGNITLTAPAGKTINGASTVSFKQTWGSIRLVGTSTTNWAASSMPAP